VDIINIFLPNYTYLGERLRSGDLPGWNPYSSSGIPFLGDAQSGWGYLPAMLSFTFLSPFTALQANYFIHIFLAGIGAYALSRITGIGVWGATAAGLAYEYGAIVAQLRAVNVQAQMTAWIPFAFIGVELAVRAKTLRGRACGWALSGLAISQMIVGWTGQGSVYALFIVGAYVFFRMLFLAVTHWAELSAIFVQHVSAGLAILFFGLGLSAAGLWIRVVANQDSVIESGDYSQAVGASHRANYLSSFDLFARVLVPTSYYYVGAATLSLAILAFFVVQNNRWRVWLYCFLIIVTIDLTITEPLLRPLLFRLPLIQQLHEHNVAKGLNLLGLSIALLAGMTVDALVNWKGDWHHLAGLACIPIFAAAGLSYWARSQDPGFLPEPRKTAMAVGLIIGAYALILAARSLAPAELFRVAQGMAMIILLIAIVWDPFGDQFGKRLSGRATVLPPSQTFATYLSKVDPNGPGEYLQAQLNEEGPFRFLGYGPSILASEGSRANRTYHGRFRDRLVVELLFGRAMRLELPSVQGYNPIQNKRYTEFLVAVNGKTQNYHDTNILSGGVDSPLLRLLHVRYIVVERNNSPTFEELARLEKKFPIVFEDDTVKILEVTDALPHSWIVHEAEQASREEALAFIQTNEFDPTSVAVIEGQPPNLKKTKNPDNERVIVTRYGADKFELSASLRTPGLVVVSEIYARGWQAFVDGKPAKIYPSDYVLRGVAVPAGDHTIVFRYAPAAISQGIGITLATVVLLIALIAQPWRFRFQISRQLKWPRWARGGGDHGTSGFDGLKAMKTAACRQPEFRPPGRQTGRTEA
jgi:hypothetical protein